MLKVALAGAGMISRFHLEAWRKLGDRARVVAICDPDPGRAPARAAEFGIARTCGTMDELFAAQALDAVDIASPRETHAAWVDAAVRHGIAVLCQKPMTPTLDEAEALVARTAGRIRFMVHDNWRFRPWYRALAGWIRDGELGDIDLAAMALFSSGLLPGPDGTAPMLARQLFMRDERRLLLAEVMIHHLDTLRFLCGEMDVLSARLARGVQGVRGETSGSVLLAGRNGATISLSGSLAAPGCPAMPADRIEILGSRATAILDGTRLSLQGPRSRQLSFEQAEGYQASFDGAIGHFVDGLTSGLPFETDARDNLGTMRLVEAAYRAAGMA